ncbi:hypothetical protein V8F33_004482 [Rhypophila sp. PSN 637]
MHCLLANGLVSWWERKWKPVVMKCQGCFYYAVPPHLSLFPHPVAGKMWSRYVKAGNPGIGVKKHFRGLIILVGLTLILVDKLCVVGCFPYTKLCVMMVEGTAHVERGVNGELPHSFSPNFVKFVDCGAFFFLPSLGTSQPTSPRWSSEIPMTSNSGVLGDRTRAACPRTGAQQIHLPHNTELGPESPVNVLPYRTGYVWTELRCTPAKRHRAPQLWDCVGVANPTPTISAQMIDPPP